MNIFIQQFHNINIATPSIHLNHFCVLIVGGILGPASISEDLDHDDIYYFIFIHRTLPNPPSCPVFIIILVGSRRLESDFQQQDVCF